MAIAKRIALFLVLNFVVVSFISFLLYIFNIQPFLTEHGLNLGSLAFFCLVWGMGGSLISLLLSKKMAYWMMGVKQIDPKSMDPNSIELLRIIRTQAEKAGLPKMPEVGIYESPEVNAFATGPSKSNALVAVSTGLLRRLNHDQVEGVLGHEITHIANGDMVTMCLLQGVINAFVMFFARAVAYVITRGLSDSKEESRSPSPFVFQMIVFALEMVFMVLGTMIVASFSRKREFRADFGGARLASPEKMISALNALKKTQEIQDVRKDQPAFQAFKISSPSGFMRLFATHPPLDERIASLEYRYKLTLTQKS
jgi:heat shock protein HtpX